MLRIFMAFVVAVAVLSVAPRPAQSYEGPWCAVADEGLGFVSWNCQYRSLEECVPHVLGGNRGFCEPNPRFVAPVRGRHHHGKQ